jgi:Ca-activated chloride channel family protein
MDKSPDPLAGLVDIPLPEAISLWPATWPARIVIALIVAGAVIASAALIRRWYVNRYRRAALAELDRIVSATPDAEALALLVRRTALAVFPREQIAALSGANWLSFLDRSCGGTEFSQGPGRALARGPYDLRALPQAEFDGAVTVVRSWIRSHHV